MNDTSTPLPDRLDWPSAGIGPGPHVPPERRVTRDNWRLYPFSRWAFQHTRELVPSRALPRSHPPAPLSVEPLPLEAVAFDGTQGRTSLADLLDDGFHDAMLVLHRGVVRFEHYANGMTAETPHMLFSITKSLIGLVAERLIARGALDPEARVDAIVPELAGSGFAPVSLRHLLDMTDGVDFDENYADPRAQVHLYSAAYWTPTTAGHGGVLGKLPTLVAREAEPGTLFRYRTPVADVVALVLTRATGRSLRDLVAEEVWRPAGCGEEAYMLVDTAGMEIGGTGLNATTHDMARIALWLLAPDQRGLVETLLGGGDRNLFAASVAMERCPGGSYRSLWWIDHGEPPMLAANGVYGQRLWIDPVNDLALITFGSHPIAGNSATDAVHNGAFAAIRAALARA